MTASFSQLFRSTYWEVTQLLILEILWYLVSCGKVEYNFI